MYVKKEHKFINKCKKVFTDILKKTKLIKLLNWPMALGVKPKPTAFFSIFFKFKVNPRW